MIGLWLSLVNSPGFGSNVVLPSENHARYYMLVFAMVWNDIATPSWSTFTFFHQNLVTLSGPGVLQFFFLARTFVASTVSRFQGFSDGGENLAINCRVYILEPLGVSFPCPLTFPVLFLKAARILDILKHLSFRIFCRQPACTLGTHSLYPYPILLSCQRRPGLCLL